MTETDLICGVNWLGDSVMLMPALQVYRRARPGRRLAILVRRPLDQLWRLHNAPDDVIPCDGGTPGTWRAVRDLRQRGMARAFVMPNSFRSALIPWAAGIPERTGRRGHARAWMLSRVVAAPPVGAGRHQQWEYFDVLGVEPPDGKAPAPALAPARQAGEAVSMLDDGAGPLLGVIPGAARGSSKQWPPARFVETVRRVRAAEACRVAVFGTGAEHDLCDGIVRALETPALNLAGQTDLATLAAGLARCDVVLSNDCGGMHLAAAVGTRVVAVFGVTDPRRTGPLGGGHRIIAAEGVRPDRDVPRESIAATAALRSITSEQVGGAVLDVLHAES